MGSSMFDDIMAGAVVAKHVFRGASKAYAKAKQIANSEKGQQLRREEEAYEKELRREENERDWAIFIGEDPDKYR